MRTSLEVGKKYNFFMEREKEPLGSALAAHLIDNNIVDENSYLNTIKLQQS